MVFHEWTGNDKLPRERLRTKLLFHGIRPGGLRLARHVRLLLARIVVRLVGGADISRRFDLQVDNGSAVDGRLGVALTGVLLGVLSAVADCRLLEFAFDVEFLDFIAAIAVPVLSLLDPSFRASFLPLS